MQRFDFNIIGLLNQFLNNRWEAVGRLTCQPSVRFQMTLNTLLTVPLTSKHDAKDDLQHFPSVPVQISSYSLTKQVAASNSSNRYTSAGFTNLEPTRGSLLQENGLPGNRNVRFYVRGQGMSFFFFGDTPFGVPLKPQKTWVTLKRHPNPPPGLRSKRSFFASRTQKLTRNMSGRSKSPPSPDLRQKTVAQSGGNPFMWAKRRVKPPGELFFSPPPSSAFPLNGDRERFIAELGSQRALSPA